MRIVMIGSGYVGLVSGACFADFGHEVVCVDKDEGRIAALERLEIPIFEPGLEDMVAPVYVRGGSLSRPKFRRRSDKQTSSLSRLGPPRGAETGTPTFRTLKQLPAKLPKPFQASR